MFSGDARERVVHPALAAGSGRGAVRWGCAAPPARRRCCSTGAASEIERGLAAEIPALVRRGELRAEHRTPGQRSPLSPGGACPG